MYQAEGKLCHSTIKCYLSAVHQMHVAKGYGDPRMSSMARLEQVLKGIKSLQARTRGRSLPRSAAQNERGVAEKRYHLGLWAAVTLCFFGFFRSREITMSDEPPHRKLRLLVLRDVSARRTVIRSHPRHTYPSAGRKG